MTKTQSVPTKKLTANMLTILRNLGLSLLCACLTLTFAQPARADALKDDPWKIISKLEMTPLNDLAKSNVLGLKAKANVVVFWASWCDFCKAQLTQLRRDSASWSKDDVQVIGLSIEDELSKAQAYETSSSSKFAMYNVTNPAARKKLEIPKLPMTLILNSAGDVKAAYSGFNEERYQLMIKSIKSLVTPGQHD